jgi:hypothetical protein
MPDGLAWTRLTAWVALTGWAAGQALWLLGRRQPSLLPAARLLWTAGALLHLVHVAAAFHTQHGWSHAEAVAFTARVTADHIGWRWGGGIWFNHLFAALWLADAAAAWRAPADVDARRWRTAARCFLAFMVVQGGIVFAVAPGRWYGVALVMIVAVAWWKGRRGTAA